MKKIILSAALAASAILAPVQVSAINPLDALSGIVSNLTSSSNFQISDIVGTWEYQSPAVSFKSDNALNKIGGVAASTALEDKLVQYYNTAGLNTLVLTVNEDETFSMKVKAITLSGTITKDDDGGNLTFHFSAFGKVNIGSVSAMAEKSALNTLTITFDASRVISIIEKVAAITKNSTIQTLSSLLGSYDGLYAGARMKKVGSSNSSSTTSKSSSTPASTTTESGTNNSSNAASKAAEALKGLFNK